MDNSQCLSTVSAEEDLKIGLVRTDANVRCNALVPQEGFEVDFEKLERLVLKIVEKD